MARPDRKAQSAAQVIRNRILHGDHLHDIPAERPLAEELGISRQTIRRALQLLEDEGALVRGQNGRFKVAPAPTAAKRKPVVGFVKHSYPSHDHQMWAEGIYTVIEGRQLTLRSVTFDHYSAPHIAAAINEFDVMFFLPGAGAIPPWLIERMVEAPCRTVILDQDVSAAGLPSILMFPPKAEKRLLQHLQDLGHRKIDCLNTQPRNSVIEARISSWRSFLEAEGMEGTLYCSTDLPPLESAYQLVRDTLRAGISLGPGVHCTTAPGALGAMRAFYEAGIRVGRDVSVCAVNDEGIGMYLVPSLTCLRSLPRAHYLGKALDWMLSTDEWEGPLLLQPNDADVPLSIGESTGPCPRRTKSAHHSPVKVEVEQGAKCGSSTNGHAPSQKVGGRRARDAGNGAAERPEPNRIVKIPRFP